MEFEMTGEIDYSSKSDLHNVEHDVDELRVDVLTKKIQSLDRETFQVRKEANHLISEWQSSALEHRNKLEETLKVLEKIQENYDSFFFKRALIQDYEEKISEMNEQIFQLSNKNDSESAELQFCFFQRIELYQKAMKAKLTEDKSHSTVNYESTVDEKGTNQVLNFLPSIQFTNHESNMNLVSSFENDFANSTVETSIATFQTEKQVNHAKFDERENFNYNAAPACQVSENNIFAQSSEIQSEKEDWCNKNNSNSEFVQGQKSQNEAYSVDFSRENAYTETSNQKIKNVNFIQSSNRTKNMNALAEKYDQLKKSNEMLVLENKEIKAQIENIKNLECVLKKLSVVFKFLDNNCSSESNGVEEGQTAHEHDFSVAVDKINLFYSKLDQSDIQKLSILDYFYKHVQNLESQILELETENKKLVENSYCASEIGLEDLRRENNYLKTAQFNLTQENEAMQKKLHLLSNELKFASGKYELSACSISDSFEIVQDLKSEICNLNKKIDNFIEDEAQMEALLNLKEDENESLKLIIEELEEKVKNQSLANNTNVSQNVGSNHLSFTNSSEEQFNLDSLEYTKSLSPNLTGWDDEYEEMDTVNQVLVQDDKSADLFENTYSDFFVDKEKLDVNEESYTKADTTLNQDCIDTYRLECSREQVELLLTKLCHSIEDLAVLERQAEKNTIQKLMKDKYLEIKSTKWTFINKLLNEASSLSLFEVSAERIVCLSEAYETLLFEPVLEKHSDGELTDGDSKNYQADDLNTANVDNDDYVLSERAGQVLENDNMPSHISFDDECEKHFDLENKETASLVSSNNEELEFEPASEKKNYFPFTGVHAFSDVFCLVDRKLLELANFLKQKNEILKIVVSYVINNNEFQDDAIFDHLDECTQLIELFNLYSEKLGTEFQSDSHDAKREVKLLFYHVVYTVITLNNFSKQYVNLIVSLRPILDSNFDALPNSISQEIIDLVNRNLNFDNKIPMHKTLSDMELCTSLAQNGEKESDYAVEELKFNCDAVTENCESLLKITHILENYKTKFDANNNPSQLMKVELYNNLDNNLKILNLNLAVSLQKLNYANEKMNNLNFANAYRSIENTFTDLNLRVCVVYKFFDLKFNELKNEITDLQNKVSLNLEFVDSTKKLHEKKSMLLDKIELSYKKLFLKFQSSLDKLFNELLIPQLNEYLVECVMACTGNKNLETNDLSSSLTRHFNDSTEHLNRIEMDVQNIKKQVFETCKLVNEDYSNCLEEKLELESKIADLQAEIETRLGQTSTKDEEFNSMGQCTMKHQVEDDIGESSKELQKLTEENEILKSHTTQLEAEKGKLIEKLNENDFLFFKLKQEFAAQTYKLQMAQTELDSTSNAFEINSFKNTLEELQREVLAKEQSIENSIQARSNLISTF